MPVEFTSPVWNDLQRKDVVTRCLTRIAKRFKSERVAAMVAGPHTGIIYTRGAGDGFRRFHKASARGERPSPDTTNLINSLEDQKLSATEHAVYVDDAKAPYGKWLQDPQVLDRPIATLDDALLFLDSGRGRDEINKATGEMANGVTGVTL